MNLMGMVNGLNRLDDTNPFSPTAFLLAVKLIDLFNRLFWADSVAVDLARMGVMAKCTSKATITRARDELVERGVLVIVRKGKKGTPTTYRMNDISAFGSKNEQNPGTNPEQYAEQKTEHYPERYAEQKTVPIYRQDYRQDKTRQRRYEEDEEEEDAFGRTQARVREMVVEVYPCVFGVAPTPAEVESLTVLFTNLHLEEIVAELIRMAGTAAPRNRLAYLRALATSMHDDYIRTPEDLQDHQVLQGFVRQFPAEAAEWAKRLLDAREIRKERYTA